MLNHCTRRELLRAAGLAAAGTALGASDPAGAAKKKTDFKISLAEWSLHRTLQKGEITNLDFPRVAKQDYGINAVEFVNQFFKDKARDQVYLKELKKRAKDEGVKMLLIMCDGEGNLGDADAGRRATAVENHKKWIDAAKFLGCHSIRVNAYGEGSPADVAARVADSGARLVEYSKPLKIGVIIENHGGLSSDPDWLAGVIKQVNSPLFGTLPDFGNFYQFDRYEAVRKLMPFARGVSAKSHEFDAQGNETKTDYFRMMRIVMDAGYHKYVGIEYEGSKHSEPEGIRLTKRLLERFRESG